MQSEQLNSIGMVQKAVVYRAHWEDPLTRFFEQLFGPLEWNTLAIQDHYQCVWYSYFHPYPIWVSNTTIPTHHPWQTLLQSHHLTHPLTMTFHHQVPDFVTVINNYSTDPYCGGLEVVSGNLKCSIPTLLNFPYQSVSPLSSSETSEDTDDGIANCTPMTVPPELVNTIENWMGKASKAVVKLAAEQPHWYQQRLQLQPVDTRWWHHVITQQQQLIELLRKGLSSGVVACEELAPLVPFEVLPTTISLTIPSSIPIVAIPEPVLLQHHRELIKLVDIINDPRATTLLVAGILDSGQVLSDNSGKVYPAIPIFEGGRILRVQGDSPVLLNGQVPEWPDSTDGNVAAFPLILDSYTSDLSCYTTAQLTSLLRYINGLQDSDGSGDRKYILLQNRIVHTLARRRQQHQTGMSPSPSSSSLS